jgi:hypothetical protein
VLANIFGSLRIYPCEQGLNVTVLRPVSLQGLYSFLYGRVGKNIEYVCSALQQALRAGHHDHAFTQIGRCPDQLCRKRVDRLVVNLSKPARRNRGTKSIEIDSSRPKNIAPARRLFIETLHTHMQIGNTRDTLY